MLTELLLQFFDDQPRRKASIYSLLTGKKTISTLYAAMLHHQLQWLQFYPTLAREDFQAALAKLLAQEKIHQTSLGLVLADPAAKAKAAEDLPLPTAFRPNFDLAQFAPKFYLAVQVVSEALAGERRYRPITSDWQTQQAIRRWYHRVAGDPAQVAAELTAAFTTLPQETGDLLASRLVGHDYVGQAHGGDLAAQLQETEALATLVTAIASHPEWQQLNALWGGLKPLLSPSNYRAVQLLQNGLNPQQIAQQLRLKDSTVNEHILGAAIWGAKIPVAQLYDRALLAAFSAVQDPFYGDYQQLLEQVPISDFFHSRLYQILKFQERWPQHA